MMVSISELKTNASKLVQQAQDNEIIITVHGKAVAKLVALDTNPKVDALMSMKGILKGNNMTLEQAREARLARQ
jgi:prevent-host-death family protein